MPNLHPRSYIIRIERNYSMLKKITRVGVVVTTFALIASGAVTAQAAVTGAANAKTGADCARSGSVAKGKGVNGSDLTCLSITTGTMKGQLKWWYADLKPLKNIDWVVPANPGGYSLTSNAISDSLKTEGLLSEYTSVFKPGAGGATGLGFFQEIKNKPEAALITGIAMAGGIALNKSKLNLLDSKSVAKMMREYDAIVVPANSKYKNLKQLVEDIRKRGKAIAIAGGSSGGIDHQVIGTLLKTAGIPVKENLNYVVHSGGPEVVVSLLSGATQVGVSGSTEFKTMVDSGKLRVLGVSSKKKLAGYPGLTFIAQGYNMVYGNWRGVMAPADLSAGEYLNFCKVLDALKGTPTWAKVLTANNWDNDFAGGDAFKAFLTTELPAVADVIKDLGL
jgi:putative tricarboxylic transport membrane protein